MTEAEKEIYENTKKRLRRLGIENPAEVIVSLAGEIAYYRKKIQRMEKCYANKTTVIRCKDCEWWTKQSDSAQGRCALMGNYPTGAWYCGNGKRREE